MNTCYNLNEQQCINQPQMFMIIAIIAEKGKVGFLCSMILTVKYILHSRVLVYIRSPRSPVIYNVNKHDFLRVLELEVFFG